MRKIFVIMMIIFILTGCNETEEEYNGNIYTYKGFYEGLDATDEEWDIIENGVMHISEMNLLPTTEYSHLVYPIPGTTDNEYIDNHKEEIAKFLEEKFDEISVVGIDVREDRIFNYVKIGEDRGHIEYRFDVDGNNNPGYYNIVNVNVELLNSKKPNDEWDSNILLPFYDDVDWYNQSVLANILLTYYNSELTKYYSEEVAEINEYFNSTGNYFDLNGEECGYAILSTGCANVGSVMITVGYSQALETYFEKNGKLPEEYSKYNTGLLNDSSWYFNEQRMTIEEVVEFIDNNEYFSLSIFIDSFISKEVFDENNIRNLTSFDTSEEYINTMKAFTDNNLEWLVADKEEVKKIIKESGLNYSHVNLSFGLGYSIDQLDDSGSVVGKNNIYIPVRIYDGDYPELTQDLVRENESGYAASFEWKGNE